MAAEDQGALVLRFEDQLTVAHAQEAHARILTALANHASVILDVSAPEDIDLTFLQILIAANKTAKANGRRLLINAPADGMLFSKLRDAGLPVAYAPEHRDTPKGTKLEAAAPSLGASADAAKSTADLDAAAFDSLVRELGAPAVSMSLDTFFVEMQERIQALQGLSLKADLPAVLREAHSLRGTAGAFGLRRLGEDAAELERTGANLDEDAFKAIVTRIEEAFVRGRAALEAASLAA